jgi:hypothetical protein
MLNLCLEMKVLKYGFVGLLLLASAIFIIHPTQSQVFGQGANTTNTTNATDTERPTAEGLNPGFVPDSEDGAAPPPPPANAITVDKLPKENLVKDPDSDPLSIINRTEILEILPANSTKIIKHVDEDLKNSSGVGLAPSDVLEKITSEKSNDNKSIFQLASPEDIKKIESVDSSLANSTAGQEEDEPVTNATSEKAQTGGEANATATNATSGEQPSQTREEQKQAEGEKEQAKTGAEEQALAGTPEVTNMTNATNATSGEQPSQTREEQKQAEGEKEQAKTGAEEQALAGTPEVTNMTNATNATSGEQPSQTGEEKKQAGGGGGEETTTIIGKQKQTGGEETTTIIGKQKQTGGEETSQDSLNTTNVTSMLNATDSKDRNDNPEDGG